MYVEGYVVDVVVMPLGVFFRGDWKTASSRCIYFGPKLQELCLERAHYEEFAGAFALVCVSL